MIRSRAEQIEYDEKPTKYFLHLEKQNFTNKQMTKLINDDNVIITDPDKVADIQRNFYEKLYSKDKNVPERALNIPSLPDHIYKKVLRVSYI